MTLSELHAARAIAGSRYAAAISELQASLIDLAAIEGAIENKNVNPVSLEQATHGLRKIPASLYDFEHPQFAPSLRDRLSDQIAAARDAYIEGATP